MSCGSPQDSGLIGGDAALAAGHGVRWRATFGRSPAPKVRPLSLAGLDRLDDAVGPFPVPGDVAEGDKHLVGALSHRDHRIDVREDLIAVMSVRPADRVVMAAAALCRARGHERMEVASIVSAEAPMLEPSVPP